MSTDLKMPAVPPGAMWYSPRTNAFWRKHADDVTELWICDKPEWVRAMMDWPREKFEDRGVFTPIPQPGAWTDFPALPKGPMLCEVRVKNAAPGGTYAGVVFSEFDGENFSLVDPTKEMARTHIGRKTALDIYCWRPADCAEQAREAPAHEALAEQSAFETWLEKECPSGNSESVHAQWLASAAREEFLEEQSLAKKKPVVKRVVANDPQMVRPSDMPGIAAFTPPPERVKPEPMATPVSTLRRGWRWLESQS